VVWSPAAQREVRASLGGTGAAHAAATGERVVAGIDRYVTGWISTRVEVAGTARAGGPSTGLGPAAALEWRMACLDRRLDEVRALVAELTGAGPGVAIRALDGVAALTTPQVCVDRDVAAMRPPPEEPARRARHAELVLVLAEVQAKMRVGKRKEAAALAETLVADARALADLSLLADATLQHAVALQSAGEFDRSAARYRDAVLAAAAAGEPRLEARAWSDLITLSINAGRGRPADDVIMAARAAIARSDGAPEIALPFEQAMAMVAVAEGRPADAEQHWRRALELATSGLPADHPRHAVTRLGIATTLAEQRKHEEALAAVIEAREVAIRVYGPDHPDLAQYWGSQSVMEFGLTRFEESLASAERAIAVAEPGTLYAGLGPLYKAGALIQLGRPNDALTQFAAAAAAFRKNGNHAQEYQALLSLGLEQFNRGLSTEAKVALEQALEVGERAFGPGAWQVAYPTTVLGLIAQDAGDHALARRRCGDAVSWIERAFGPDSDNLTMSLICLSSAQRGLARTAEARSFAERAVKISDLSPMVNDQIEARLELARVLRAARTERRRVQVLVQEALARVTDPEQKQTIEEEF
jgi:tetratricopeptide (TPR) repeat protein